MSLELGKRVKLCQDTLARLTNQMDRLKVEIEKILREISLDIEKDPE